MQQILEISPGHQQLVDKLGKKKYGSAKTWNHIPLFLVQRKRYLRRIELVLVRFIGRLYRLIFYVQPGIKIMLPVLFLNLANSLKTNQRNDIFFSLHTGCPTKHDSW